MKRNVTPPFTGFQIRACHVPWDAYIVNQLKAARAVKLAFYYKMDFVCNALLRHT